MLRSTLVFTFRNVSTGFLCQPHILCEYCLRNFAFTNQLKKPKNLSYQPMLGKSGKQQSAVSTKVPVFGFSLAIA